MVKSEGKISWKMDMVVGQRADVSELKSLIIAAFVVAPIHKYELADGVWMVLLSHFHEFLISKTRTGVKIAL